MPLRKQHMGLRELLYIAAFLSIFALGVGSYVYIDTFNNERAYTALIKRAQSMATLVDPRLVNGLTASESDLDNPAYIYLKEKLTALIEKNEDLEFIYLMGKEGNRIYFLVDSEPPDSEDYSPPGQEYEEASFELFNGWAPHEPYVLEIDEDRWGEWISALAPVVDENGETIALLGIDQDAKQHRISFLIQIGLLALATIALLSLVSSQYVLNTKEKSLTDMKSDFVAVASHELRSPLTAIRWSLSGLRNDPAIAPNIRDIVNDLYRKVCALIDLTSTLLLTTSADHGVIRAAEFKVFNAAQTLSNAIAHAQSLALMKKIRITSDIDPAASISIKGDEERVRLIFDNVLSNALKYSPEGSTVSITHEDAGKIKRFTIKDQGIGIPKDELKNIFSGFHRASNAARSGAVGSGFGLYMAKKIASFHGGDITAESETGKGTAFTITLPTGV
ncbi:sensor histidine kinase [Candidatus Kaiserbacteria bacterium]|nr:sensor histidine kinase [Candidatus Kaiserbacteria bacterium]